MATITYENPLTIKVDDNTGLLILVDTNGKRLSRAELPNDLLNLARERGVLTADLPPASDPRLQNTQQEPAVTAQVAAAEDPAPLTPEQTQANVNEQVAQQQEAATNSGASETLTQQRYETGGIVDLTNGDQTLEMNSTKPLLLQRTVPGVPDGAEKPSVTPSVTRIFDKKGNKLGKDLRVRIKVPPKYLEGFNAPLSLHHGILFPYTPQINYELKADYGTASPIHTNFSIYFYQRSSIGPITITGKFSVENEDDAIMLVATLHCLKSLTRMRFGGAKEGDVDSGAPPPVCRLQGHGESILDNVPVVISNFRVELPDSVDYFTLRTNYSNFTAGSDDYVTSLPTVCTLNVTCLPVFSRNEMQGFSVTKYINGAFRNQGII